MIQKKIRSAAESVALQAEMAAFKASLTEGMQDVKAKIRLITSHSLQGTPTGAVLDDAGSASGKMLRPWLLLQCSSFGPLHEENHERLAMLAAMVELTHQASLIHDDIIDEAPYRRGKLSLQKQYGKHAAVYVRVFVRVSGLCDGGDHHPVQYHVHGGVVLAGHGIFVVLPDEVRAGSSDTHLHAVQKTLPQNASVRICRQDVFFAL